MNTKILTTIGFALLATLSASTASGHDAAVKQLKSGIYAGGQLGLMINNTPLTYKPFSYALTRTTLHSNDIHGTLYLGIRKIIKRAAISAEAGMTIPLITDGNAISQFQAYQHRPAYRALRPNQVYFFDLMPGLMVAPNTMIYGRTGLGLGHFTLIRSYRDTQDQDVSPNPYMRFWKAGVRLGLGVESALTDNLSYRLDYVFSNYSTISRNDDQAFEANYRPQLGTIALGVTYLLPNNLMTTAPYQIFTYTITDGTYFGGQLGHTMAYNEFYFKHNTKSWNNSTSAALQPYFGYGKKLFSNHAYLGEEIGSIFNLPSTFTTRSMTNDNYDTSELKQHYTLYLDTRLGYLLCHNIMPYIKVGSALSSLSLTTTYTHDNAPINESSKHLLGFRYGLGVETMISRRWSTRLDYTITTYGGSFVIPYNFGTDHTTQHYLHLRTSVLALGFTYIIPTITNEYENTYASRNALDISQQQAYIDKDGIIINK